MDDDKETNHVTEVKSHEEIVGKRELLGKGIRQVIRRSNMIAKQVVCIQSALSLGFVSQLWVDTSLWEVVAVEVRPSMLSGEIEQFILQDVCQIGDVVLVEDERVLEEQIRMMGLDTLVGYSVITQSRRKIGKFGTSTDMLEEYFDIERGSGSGLASRGDFGESSVMTIGSSHCGSNQLRKGTDLSRVSSNGVGSTGMFQGPVKEDTRKVFPHSERGLTKTLETNSTSSSGGSGGSFIGASAIRSTRRSRASEIHNLSERRRRDRINEKMRALQELIPHCNKSDKALMLEEAIKYLKSLQLQVHMMGMGSGMASMMFPGVQHTYHKWVWEWIHIIPCRPPIV
ncbi:hypothetical protein IFM89_031115 [Coptis chinensis]|uniref:BHLH domain-containing protein n=1 Tax=Coptis chinensis TaxID=261450 RepID=A0A835MAD2_9MAGN|nr:hypothetical protein IFM89_031115 [Coptis chinensis]